MHFARAGEEWTTVADRGVQQGGSHSSYVFSHVIDAILSRFNATLVARGATQTFQVFDWAYIDDIIIREQAAKEFPLLLELLQQAGLVLNLDKTTVAAPLTVSLLASSI